MVRHKANCTKCLERRTARLELPIGEAVLALRMADGYDETLSAEVRGPSVPCMTSSLNGSIRRCACAAITARGLAHARLALCFSLSTRASG